MKFYLSDYFIETAVMSLMGMGSDQVKKLEWKEFGALSLLSPFCGCPPARSSLNAVPADGNPGRVCVPGSCHRDRAVTGMGTRVRQVLCHCTRPTKELREIPWVF